MIPQIMRYVNGNCPKKPLSADAHDKRMTDSGGV
jgi:hypothetical protein